MSRDRFRSRGGGRGGLHDFRSPPPGMGLNQNRGPMGPGPGQGGSKPPIPPPPPHQHQQQPPPHQQPPPPQDSSKPVGPRGRAWPGAGSGRRAPASGSAAPATPPTSGAPAARAPPRPRRPQSPRRRLGRPRPRRRAAGSPPPRPRPGARRLRPRGAQAPEARKAAKCRAGRNPGFKARLSLLRRPGEKTYTPRCRLFVGKLPADIMEDEFKRLCAKYGEPGELRVRFATRAAACSSELLEEAFSQFGPIERAVVIVDDRGRFASKPAARKAFERCSEGVSLLTTTPRPVIVEPLEQLDDEDGLPQRLAQKNPMYQKERETPPRFAQHGTFEYEYSQRWKSLDEMEKQQREQVEKNMKDAKDKLENEMEDAYHEHQAHLLRQDLMRRQEELRHLEKLHNQEMQKHKEMQLRQEEERRRREEEMMIWQREMEEQMRRQRDEKKEIMRMGGGGAMNMGDPYGSGGQNVGLAPAFGPARDPGDPGSNPTSGSRCMGPASPSACVSASLSLSLSV
ncbi:unnamed protein product [Nyctereutes procyonoides]|uniref:(raccoon dog) hypothetical protein n=1 Tax=Nyctereutes procyonoides TaxID=34880 RepID=A0A811YFV9_NYCPR|nr:unnamed protein product [Nyctereutes procyonoides]